MGITTTIPTNLDFPNRGVLERDDFVNAQETAQDLLAGAYTVALNQYATELNDTEADINLKWEQVQSQAVAGGYSQAYIDATFTPKILDTQTAKTTPVDSDLIPLSDSASSFGLKKLSWANIKATLKTYFDTLYLALTGNQSVGGVKTFTSSPIVPTPTIGDNSTKAATTAFVKNEIPNALNATGTAPIYACRAWVSFKGTGAVTINKGGNTSSITDNAVGDYTMNFTAAMPDALYALAGSAIVDATEIADVIAIKLATASTYANKTTSGVTFRVGNNNSDSAVDAFDINVFIID